eukprot:CAMPEP_0175494308 /NCGR_PEP_ID=MMETSP0096-20121207/3216_1 /TAXON_ID=311494 /ORGANISM="Alexandrium monilatum, Strain CCMP3105" /LENGTH=178 /DNA_ID=CAMNT_0016796269 /DNA_START=37 /DNA_END=572 /DNA_ORIENTATION=+
MTPAEAARACSPVAREQRGAAATPPRAARGAALGTALSPEPKTRDAHFRAVWGPSGEPHAPTKPDREEEFCGGEQNEPLATQGSDASWRPTPRRLFMEAIRAVEPATAPPARAGRHFPALPPMWKAEDQRQADDRGAGVPHRSVKAMGMYQGVAREAPSSAPRARVGVRGRVHVLAHR